MKLCNKHREYALQSPEIAKTMWCRLLEIGRAKMSVGQWDDAVGLYGSAFETADILLQGELSSAEDVDRYINTALEFVYALRKSSFEFNRPCLLSAIRTRLEHEANYHELSRPLECIVSQLIDLIYAKITQVDECMAQLYSSENINSESFH